jgi:hypothetical protein
MQVNPGRRLTAEQALAHPWLSSRPSPKPLKEALAKFQVG